jgi:hypothetical protein
MKDKLKEYFNKRIETINLELEYSLSIDPDIRKDLNREKTFIQREVLPWLNKQKAPAYEVPDDVFNQFWSLYPRKDGKANARKAFSRAVRASKDKQGCIDLILKAVEAQRAPGCPLDEEKEKRFIKHAATWLNQKVFEDELPDEEPEESVMSAERAELLKRKAGLNDYHTGS